VQGRSAPACSQHSHSPLRQFWNAYSRPITDEAKTPRVDDTAPAQPAPRPPCSTPGCSEQQRPVTPPPAPVRSSVDEDRWDSSSPSDPSSEPKHSPLHPSAEARL